MEQKKKLKLNKREKKNENKSKNDKIYPATKMEDKEKVNEISAVILTSVAKITFIVFSGNNSI